METRFLVRASQRLRVHSRVHHLRRQQHLSNNSRPSTEQANPIGEYYASILEASTQKPESKPPTTASSAANEPGISTSSDSESTEDSGPSILFSSRLSSPLERRSEIQRKSTLVAGVWVPPRPDEPDNCCMSGCVNCVWDRYRDELEEWVAKKKEADYALKKQKLREDSGKPGREVPRMADRAGTPGRMSEAETNAALVMDDDGGGSEGLWGTGLDTDLTSDDLFQNIPVGIREFMKQEKRLKEKHARERASGG